MVQDAISIRSSTDLMRQFQVFCSIVESSLSACQLNCEATRKQEWQRNRENRGERYRAV